MQVPPTSIFFDPLQAVASHAETTIKPTTRDTDIQSSNLILASRKTDQAKVS
jgi:hypothetical protein